MRLRYYFFIPLVGGRPEGAFDPAQFVYDKYLFR